MGRHPVLVGEGRLGEARWPAEGALGGRGGHRPSKCRWAHARGGARSRGEPGELAPMEAGERSRRWPAVWMQASMHPWRSVSSCPWRPVSLRPWRPASTGRRMRARWQLGKAERLGRSQRGSAVPVGGRVVSDFSGLVGGGLSGSAGARVPRGRERLSLERADGFDPDSFGRESRGRKPVGPTCKTQPA
jgi:hypothetical protein